MDNLRTSKQPGKIVILNGTSSSGKTSIIKAFQDLMPEPYLEAGIDKFIWMMPGRYLERPLWDDVLGLAVEAGETGHSLVEGMHRAIKTLAQSGLNVVADHVLVEPRWVLDCAQQLHDLDAYLVGVMCPLEVLVEREKSRKNRTLGQAAAQFPLIHRHGIYDLEVNASLLSAEECALKIKESIDAGNPPHALKELVV